MIMKLVLLVSLVTVVVSRPGQKYDSKYDNFDVNEITQNTRWLRAYAHCFRKIGKCTSEGREFQSWIPEAVRTNCSKCSEKQKVLVAKMIKAFQQKLPEEWEKLAKIYDPEQKHAANLKTLLAQYAS